MKKNINHENIEVTIDGKVIAVTSGTTILAAANANGIHIPTLCYHEDLCVSGSCRMCLVEVEGQRTLQAACAVPIVRSMNIKTRSEQVMQTRKHILTLLLSEHYGECESCAKNNHCKLQDLAKEYNIEPDDYKSKTRKYAVDESAYVMRDMDKCILCGNCISVCHDLQAVNILQKTARGKDTKVTTLADKPLKETSCINCGQCINRCPTGALTERDDIKKVKAALADPKKYVVIQTAPSPRAAIGECFGLPPGTGVTFKLNTALRKAGFKKVFDTNFTADLTILEEGSELIGRLYKAVVEKDKSVTVPQFTSCCPGWIKFVEHNYPEHMASLSSAKSPQQMFGAVIKTYFAKKNNIDPAKIVSVSLMPCLAKKFECSRPEMRASGYQDVDYVLTTRELGKMLLDEGIDLKELEDSDFDSPFGNPTGSGLIFGASGGVMEAALRTVLEIVTGIPVEKIFADADIIPVRGFDGVKYAEVKIDKVSKVVPELLSHLNIPNWDWLKGVTVKVGISHGLANARKILTDIEQGGKFSGCHFIEFMACPGGCLGGGGQPIPTSKDIRAKRSKLIYDEEKQYKYRKSHLNPDVLKIYEEFLTEGPCSHLSEKLLHTSYTVRSN